MSKIDCKETLLTEYKCRVSIDRAREEEERIEELRLSGQMSDDSIFCEVDSDDPDRFMFVKDEKELGQILHHAYVYDKRNCLHSVGNTRELMSCTKMNFALRLLEAYHQVLRLLFERCLQPFFEQDNVRKDLTGSDEFMASVAHAVEVNKDKMVDMQTFQFNYKLTCVATQLKNLPLAPS